MDKTKRNQLERSQRAYLKALVERAIPAGLSTVQHEALQLTAPKYLKKVERALEQLFPVFTRSAGLARDGLLAVFDGARVANDERQAATDIYRILAPWTKQRHDEALHDLLLLERAAVLGRLVASPVRSRSEPHIRRRMTALSFGRARYHDGKHTFFVRLKTDLVTQFPDGDPRAARSAQLVAAVYWDKGRLVVVHGPNRKPSHDRAVTADCCAGPPRR